MLSRSPPCDGAGAGTERVSYKIFRKPRKRAMSGCKNKELTIELENVTARGSAKSCCTLD